jgi:1,4-dihydroxy-2-naphthoyl-CoA hydrolase
MSAVAKLNEQIRGTLSGLVGVEVTEVRQGLLVGRLRAEPRLFAANGYLHAATVVALADTLCGCGALEYLPPGAESFTTVELKANLLGTAREGIIECTAKLVHGGRTTQVWDAEVKHMDSNRTIALFRCTQLLLYPRE